jgi:putative ABC transport system permease protein
MWSRQSLLLRVFSFLARLILPRDLLRAHRKQILDMFDDLCVEANASGKRMSDLRVLVREVGNLCLTRVSYTRGIRNSAKSEQPRHGYDWRDADTDRRLRERRVAARPENAATSPRREARVLSDLIQDVRYGPRTLARSPVFVMVAVTILTLGIGANATMFTILNSVLLRAPPLVSAPRELVAFSRISENEAASNSMMYPDYEYYRDNNDVFSGLGAYRFSRTALAVGDAGMIAQARAGFVSDNYFDVLGVPMAHGRSFLREENETPNAHPVAILGSGFWKRRFGSDPAVVGRTLLLNGISYTVVGVAPEGFRGVSSVEEPPDIFLPAMMRGFGLRRVEGQFSFSWRVVGRLRPGVDLAAAQANIDLVQERFAHEFATWIAATSPPRFRIVLTSRYQLSPRDAEELSRLLTLLFLVVGTVLLIASANVALLLLARASAREREIALRCALGAGRGRVVRQLLTESLLLALAGGAGGLLLAFWGAGIAAGLIPFSFNVDVKPDGSVALFTLALSAGAVVLFGLVPALQLSHSDLVSLLRRQESSRSRSALRNVLVVTQLTVSIVLVTGAGLFLRSLFTAEGVELGFEPERKLVTTPAITNAGYGVEEARQFVREMLDRTAALPGVVGVSTTVQIPFRGRWTRDISVTGTSDAATVIETGVNCVGPGYFNLMRIQIMAGREFTASDDQTAPPVTVVNQAFAERMWPGESALGKAILYDDRRWSVVGVARNAVYYEVGEPAQTQVYFPQLQDFSPVISFVIATAGRPQDAVGAVEDAIHQYDPILPIHRMATLRSFVKGAIAQYRVMAILVATFGGLALFLAAVGLYGLQSYLVGQRTREIGIRLALGAEAGHMARTVIGRGAFLALIGALVGVGASLASVPLIESMLFGIHARDPMTFVVAPLVLLAVAVTASLVPAWRASTADPMVALREP